MICSHGGGKYRLHTAITKLLASFAKEAFAKVEEEVVVPELLQGEPASEVALEARLDLHMGASAPWPFELWVDATHCHVWANRYRSEAAVRGGAVPSMAEADKWKRYGDGSDGVIVTTAAVESWGYFGEGLEWLLY